MSSTHQVRKFLPIQYASELESAVGDIRASVYGPNKPIRSNALIANIKAPVYLERLPRITVLQILPHRYWLRSSSGSDMVRGD